MVWDSTSIMSEMRCVNLFAYFDTFIYVNGSEWDGVDVTPSLWLHSLLGYDM